MRPNIDVRTRNDGARLLKLGLPCCAELPDDALELVLPSVLSGVAGVSSLQHVVEAIGDAEDARARLKDLWSEARSISCIGGAE